MTSVIIIRGGLDRNKDTIIFVSTRSGGTEHIFAIEDVNFLHQLTFEFPGVVRNVTPSCAYNVRQIAYLLNSSQIHSMSSFGTNDRQVTFGIQPALAPDGHRIAFFGLQSTVGIHILDLSTSQIEFLTGTSVGDGNPNWSFDGTMIAFGSTPDGDEEIYVAEIGSTQPMQITYNSVIDRQPAWSPDGSKIAYVSYINGNPDISIINLPAMTSTQITKGVEDELYSSWSLEGDHLIFTSNRDGDFEIYLIDVNTTHIVQLTRNTFDDTDPCYTPRIQNNPLSKLERGLGDKYLPTAAPESAARSASR